MTKTIVICHYEDEPGKVDLPELIKAGMYATDGVTNCHIDFEDTRNRYEISYEFQGIARHIVYLVEPNETVMADAIKKINEYDILLYIIDMSIGSDRDAGVKIVRKLIEQNVRQERIWMLTAYATEANRQSKEFGIYIKIISKPPNHINVRDDIIDLIDEYFTSSEI